MDTSKIAADRPSDEELADELIEILGELCQVPGPSGHEQEIRSRVCRHWEAMGLDPIVDPVGNALARVGGKGPRVLLQAHLDEIGYTVRHISPDGFLFLDSGQGGKRDKPERRFMVGQRGLVLRRGDVVAEGVFAAPSGHFLTEAASQQELTLSDLFVDIGAESRAEVEARGIHIGSPVVWTSQTRVWGNRVVSKALDNRLGLAIAIMAARRLELENLTCELWLGATVQEENFLHGARAMARGKEFDAVLAIDNALSGDLPTVNRTDVDSVLGAGPVIVHQDWFIAYDQALAWQLFDVAQANGIKAQHGVFTNYATDGGAFMEAGSPAVALGPPTRYTHTANELGDMRDIVATVQLLSAFVTSPRDADGRLSEARSKGKQ